MSEKIRLDRKICFQNIFYTNCINVIIDCIGPSIILRSIFCSVVSTALTELVILVNITNLIILDDFNYNIITSENNKIRNLMLHYSLSQLIITYRSGPGITMNP